MITWEFLYTRTWWVRINGKLRAPEVRYVNYAYYVFPTGLDNATPIAGPFDTLEAAKAALVVML